MEEGSAQWTGGNDTMLRVASLRREGSRAFHLEPGAEARAALAEDLGIIAIRKLRFAGEVLPDGAEDWRLVADLGATVVQPCVATLAPVTTRIEDTVMRRYLADPAPAPEGGEVEMPEDDSEEPLGDTIDLGALMREALALALPDYPRADGAGSADTRVTEPGKTPMTDEDARPFAALKGLRDKLDGTAGED